MKCLPLALLLLSCGPANAPAPITDAAPPRPSWSIHYGPVTIAPGAEPSTCLTLPGPDAPFYFSGYRSDWSAGMHHFGLYAATTAPTTTTPYPCNTPSGDEVLNLQTLHAEVNAFSSAPEYADAATLFQGAPVSLNVHAINTTPEPLLLTGELEFFIADEPPPELRAGIIKANWPTMTAPLSVPAHSTTDVVTSCHVGRDLSIVRAWGHQHAHGSRFEMRVRDELVYTSTDWEHPPVSTFDSTTSGDLTLKVGDAIELRCTVANDTATALPIGPSEIWTAEMCAMMGTYLPYREGMFPCR
jgi:hypothetical protein